MRYSAVLFIALIILLPLQASAVTLKIATLSPDGTSWMKAFRAAAKEIKKKTEGRVKVRYYPGGVMGNDKSVLRKIKVGQLHGAAIGAGGMADINPDTQIYALPFTFESYDEVDQVRKKLDNMVMKMLDEKGFISYGLTEGGFAYLMSDKKITSLKDAQSRKIWIPQGDRVNRFALEAVNISPVPLPMTDVLTGLQTGLINTISSPPTATIALQWHTKVKHLTDLPVLYTYGTVAISKKALKKVNAGDQKIISEIFSHALNQLNKGSRSDNQKALKALQKHGIKVHKVDLEVVKTWRSKVNTAINGMTGDRALSKDALKQIRTIMEKVRPAG